MTTAHRPTWNAAVASSNNPSGNTFVAQTTKVANRDAASFTKIKIRQLSQGAPEERTSRKRFLEVLERKERKARDVRDGRTPVDEKDEKGNDREARSKKPVRDTRPKIKDDNPFPEDADDDVPSGSEKAASDDDDDDEEEDTEELMRELAKIKREREAEEEKLKEQQGKVDERSRRDEVFKGNPLLQAELSLKRKWDDDTVFKNQARTAPKQKLRYINDSVRSDFHKKFLDKYVWVDGLAH